MPHPAVSVQGLWKEYRIGGQRAVGETFYDVLSGAIRRPFRHRAATNDATIAQTGADSTDGTDRFWALRDVSFDIAPGEVVGIIGRNGAGKSTLLKILSRITAPTKGRVEVRGRLASLLEVGTGFHPELSGRENIYLNGAILGMTRRDIARKFDEIVAFAEVEKFIDTPVKRYSSGMYVRLAFAVAAHLDADVLVVDEVLAVGDTAFQDKCLGKMGDLSAGGRTVLFVSHNHGALARLCQRGIVLSHGGHLFSGSTTEALHAYARHVRSEGAAAGAVITGPLAGVVRFTRITVNGREAALTEAISPSSAIEIAVDSECAGSLEEFRITLCLRRLGETVLGMHDAEAPATHPGGRWQSRFQIPALTLAPGDYSVDAYAYSNRLGQWTRAEGIGEFSIAVEWFPNYEPTHAMGVFNLPVAGRRVALTGGV
ncbi:MAG: polysaccharide ABC transporter ATP-binding protein [Burkholderiales bacterium]|nr:polysaccharide ABC transporter ATP-binding protein [Burkholderiales bacterium]